jgi:hypothetical protein
LALLLAVFGIVLLILKHLLALFLKLFAHIAASVVHQLCRLPPLCFPVRPSFSENPINGISLFSWDDGLLTQLCSEPFTLYASSVERALMVSPCRAEDELVRPFRSHKSPIHRHAPITGAASSRSAADAQLLYAKPAAPRRDALVRICGNEQVRTPFGCRCNVQRIEGSQRPKLKEGDGPHHHLIRDVDHGRVFNVFEERLLGLEILLRR